MRLNLLSVPALTLLLGCSTVRPEGKIQAFIIFEGLVCIDTLLHTDGQKWWFSDQDVTDICEVRERTANVLPAKSAVQVGHPPATSP
jgi:hypothetical protein